MPFTDYPEETVTITRSELTLSVMTLVGGSVLRMPV